MKSSRGSTSQFLLFCGILAPVMMMVIILVIGQITPDYNPISDTICQMGTPERPYAIVLNGGYIIYGILMCLAAYGLYRSISSTATAQILTILLCIHAMGTILLGVFPDSMDLLPKHFTADLLHNTVSAISYLPLLAGILVSRGITRQEKTLKVTGILGLVIIIINLPMPFINMIDPLKSIGGLLQRLLSGSSFFWLSLTFFLLYRKRCALQGTGTRFSQEPLTAQSASR
jgi:hypothetical membrane protein